ncbi:ATP-grasp domain-containing protein [Kineosporia sp. J2-2]|uniref:ATP-grasp domain-containing protein n=1 Tax=Kineosporia corallincola TaxID=2835133 RepID=A0ABS5TQR9_9ACTN|nr:ATP-grasp domain-containing protein [Kineosporia corallincola]MBT0772919.1 ATP-grasp domain-containing protein [Kineosporia corallincola]
MRVVVVDPASSGAAYVGELTRPDVEQLVVMSPVVPEPYAGQAEAAVAAAGPGLTVVRLPPDYENLPVDARLEGADYVVCGGETGTGTADVLRERLGVQPRNSGPSGPRLDKYQAQKALEKNGLRAIRSASVTSADDLAEPLAWGFPLVVKPVSSAGSDGVRVVADVAELEHGVRELLGQVNAVGRRNEHVVVQEFVEGVEYIVDGFVSDDEQKFASVCRYEKKLVGGVPVYEAMTWLRQDEVPGFEELQAYVTGVLAALGVRIGCFHAELFRTDDDWVLVEVGLRPHGGGNPRFTQAFTGTSQLHMEVERAVTGRFTGGPMSPLRYRGRVVFFSVDGPVTFHADPQAELQLLDGLIHSGVSVGKGDSADAPRSLFDTFGLGFVVLQADTLEQLDAVSARARAVFADCHRPS